MKLAPLFIREMKQNKKRKIKSSRWGRLKGIWVLHAWSSSCCSKGKHLCSHGIQEAHTGIWHNIFDTWTCRFCGIVSCCISLCIRLGILHQNAFLTHLSSELKQQRKPLIYLLTIAPYTSSSKSILQTHRSLLEF